jgi:exodeoxyribonuclease V alpha subunit
MYSAAASGLAAEALAAMEGHRLLCAHRRGLRGVAYWSSLVARWLAEVQQVIPREDGHYVGEPLLITTNEYEVACTTATPASSTTTPTAG